MSSPDNFQCFVIRKKILVFDATETNHLFPKHFKFQEKATNFPEKVRGIIVNILNKINYKWEYVAVFMLFSISFVHSLRFPVVESKNSKKFVVFSAVMFFIL